MHVPISGISWKVTLNDRIYIGSVLCLSEGTPFLRPSAYNTRVGGISPRCGIEQIHESSISSSAHSQSEQYLIGERFIPPTLYNILD